MKFIGPLITAVGLLVLAAGALHYGRPTDFAIYFTGAMLILTRRVH